MKSNFFPGLAAVCLAMVPALPAQVAPAEPVYDWLFVDAAPTVTAQARPLYPVKEVAQGANGEVTLQFVVDDRGLVNEADIMVLETTEQAFSRAAGEAVLKWKFQPGTKDGHPVRTRLQAVFAFDADARVRELLAPGAYQAYTGEIATAKDLQSARPIVRLRPDFPYRLRDQGIGGEVILQLVVTPEGDVRNVRVANAAHPALAAAAANSLLRWKFEPATWQGRPVATRLLVPFKFDVQVRTDTGIRP